MLDITSDSFIYGMIIGMAISLPIAIISTYYGIKKGFQDKMDIDKKCPICDSEIR